MDYLQKPTTFYLCAHSVYDRSEEDNVVNWLWKQPEAKIICVARSEIRRFTNMKEAYVFLNKHLEIDL